MTASSSKEAKNVPLICLLWPCISTAQAGGLAAITYHFSTATHQLRCMVALSFSGMIVLITVHPHLCSQPERVFDQDHLDEGNMLNALRGLMFGDFMVQGAENKVRNP